MSAETWAEFLQTREPRLLSQLMTQWRPLVRLICRRTLHQPADVDDAVQETFLRFLQQVDRIRGSPTGWLAATANAVSVDLVRRTQRERRRGPKQTSPRSKLEYWTVHEQIGQHLDDALRTLDEVSRQRIIDHYYGKVPVLEIARREGVSQATIRRRLAGSLSDLAAALRIRGAPVDD